MDLTLTCSRRIWFFDNADLGRQQWWFKWVSATRLGNLDWVSQVADIAGRGDESMTRSTYLPLSSPFLPPFLSLCWINKLKWRKNCMSYFSISKTPTSQKNMIRIIQGTADAFWKLVHLQAKMTTLQFRVVMWLGVQTKWLFRWRACWEKNSLGKDLCSSKIKYFKKIFVGKINNMTFPVYAVLHVRFRDISFICTAVYAPSPSTSRMKCCAHWTTLQVPCPCSPCQ